MENIIKNKKTPFQEKLYTEYKQNIKEKFSNLCVKVIEHRTQSARSTYFGAR